MLTAQESQNMIIDAIINKKPLAVGKIGANECNTIYTCISNIPVIIPDLETVAGVFPLNQNTIDEFSKIYLEDLKEVNILLSWAQQWGESQILSHIGYNNYKTEYWEGIEPWFINDNWTNYLKDKKILMISSHINSIEYQYPNLDKIWNGRLFKNKFELYLLKPPFQPQFERYHNSWFETLEWLKQSIKEIDFDILIIGAGAYGLPLTVEAKRLGKIGIHLGGSIQILFGLKGKRWDQWEKYQNLYNDYWIRPLGIDTPKQNYIIEEGCYW